jgi:TRAP-type uncharacterized transport system fused permease subunit
MKKITLTTLKNECLIEGVLHMGKGDLFLAIYFIAVISFILGLVVGSM